MFGLTVIVDVLAPFDHKYVPPVKLTVAFNVVDCPWQIVGLFNVTVGIGLTVI